MSRSKSSSSSSDDESVDKFVLFRAVWQDYLVFAKLVSEPVTQFPVNTS